MARRLPAGKSPWLSNKVAAGTFSYGAESSNARLVTLQLTDAQGVNLTERAVVRVYLSQALGGAAIVTTAPPGGVAIGASGAILQTVTTGKDWFFITDATGKVTFTVTDATGAATYYPNCVLSDGRVSNGAALTFAA